jgi:hypothetical protein
MGPSLTIQGNKVRKSQNLPCSPGVSVTGKWPFRQALGSAFCLTFALQNEIRSLGQKTSILSPDYLPSVAAPITASTSRHSPTSPIESYNGAQLPEDRTYPKEPIFDEVQPILVEDQSEEPSSRSRVWAKLEPRHTDTRPKSKDDQAVSVRWQTGLGRTLMC